jgi:hypothetical protein
MKTNFEIVGEIGEKIVVDYLNGTLSPDKYDMVKDLTDANGRDVEVKTQNRYWAENSFSVHKNSNNQIQKCIDVDRLIFVEYGSNSNINLWECTDRSHRPSPNGANCILFPIENMTLLATLDLPDEAKMLQKYSSAGRQYLRTL